MTAYTPRRCGKRWLDGDCPKEVLAIIDHGDKYGAEQFDVIFTDVYGADTYAPNGWLGGLSISESGSRSHFEMRVHEMAAYRYRMKHRYTKWSTLPEAVKNAVRRDIAEAAEWTEANA